MAINLERKTVFLYPELRNLERSEILLTTSLITDINLVVDSANNTIRQILSSGKFSFINCLPTVFMKSISESSEACIDCNNVRICIAAYNDLDYTDNYRQLIDEYHNGKSDISHLVAIHISDKVTKAQFSKDKNGNFDVIVTSNVDHIENILVAIMLDISLFHYFLLSNELDFRKKFNEIKYNYLVGCQEQSELYATYGIKSLPDGSIYLPLSLPFVTRLDRFTNEENRIKFIGELIDHYANVLIKLLPYKVECNNRGNLINNPNDKSLKNYDAICDFVKKNRDNKKFFIIVPDKLTEKSDILMIQYDLKNDKVTNWINKDLENIGSYQIVEVVERIHE